MLVHHAHFLNPNDLACCQSRSLKIPYKAIIKGELQWKNDLGLYFSLVLVMKIGMCDLVIFHLV